MRNSRIFAFFDGFLDKEVELCWSIFKVGKQLEDLSFALRVSLWNVFMIDGLQALAEVKQFSKANTKRLTNLESMAVE